jgi:hypothetical protein
MLAIFCGDDSAASREAYTKTKFRLRPVASDRILIDPKEVLTLPTHADATMPDLFGITPLYETTRLIPTLKRSLGRKLKEYLLQIASHPSLTVIDWEDASAYDLGIHTYKASWIHDHPVTHNTFTFLKLCRPGNATSCLKSLQLLCTHQPIEVTFSMLQKQVRLMIALQTDLHLKENPYLVNLAKATMVAWPPKRLLSFHHQLQKIEINFKTGSNTPLSLRQQLEIVLMMMV